MDSIARTRSKVFEVETTDAMPRGSVDYLQSQNYVNTSKIQRFRSIELLSAVYVSDTTSVTFVGNYIHNF